MDTDVYPKSVDQIESWDFEADVVIAGYGIAGVAAQRIRDALGLPDPA